MSTAGFATSYTSVPRDFFLGLIAADPITPEKEPKRDTVEETGRKAETTSPERREFGS